MITRKEKLDMPFAVKADAVSGHKEVDMTKRIVDVIANTYYYFDSDMDVLLPGCCAKSIQDRGPNSDKPGKIKHFSNHDIHKGIGLPKLIEETQLEGKYVLHANSYMSETKDGEETLIKYQEGLIDQHSIGYRYLDIRWLEAESAEFDDMLKYLINPEEAIDAGMMWIVKEIMLYEFSSLDSFGANRLTPYLGVKSENKIVQYNNFIGKLEALHQAMKAGVKDKDIIEMQELQIKQMIYELYNQEPDLKGTLNGPPDEPTVDIINTINNHKFLK